MSDADAPRPANRLLASLRRETVTKDDGRYLIYYSWPVDRERADDSDDASTGQPARPDHRPAPPLSPWTSQAEPPAERSADRPADRPAEPSDV